MLYWLIIIKLFSCRKGPFCGRLWLLVLHSVYVRMRHPGLRRPYFDVLDASIRTLYETWHSFLHIKDHATGRANWLESDGYLLHIRLIRSRIMWVSHPLFVCYCTNVGFLSLSDGKYGCYGCQELNKFVGQAVAMCQYRICQKTRYLYLA